MLHETKRPEYFKEKSQSGSKPQEAAQPGQFFPPSATLPEKNNLVEKNKNLIRVTLTFKCIIKNCLNWTFKVNFQCQHIYCN